VLRQFYLMRGSAARVLPLFAWVVIDIVLWGFITRYLNAVSTAGLDFVPLLLGAVLLWDFFTRVMHGVSMAFLEDVWSRNFLNLFASPLTIGEYLCGLVLTSVATSSAGLLVMVGLASAVFGLSFFGYGLPIVPFGPASEWLVWPLPALLSPFAAVFYPVSTLPHWMRQVSRLLPPSYVFEGIRAILAGGDYHGGGLAWSLFLVALYILLASFFFARIHRHAVRPGLLARYSAESVS